MYSIMSYSLYAYSFAILIHFTLTIQNASEFEVCKTPQNFYSIFSSFEAINHVKITTGLEFLDGKDFRFTFEEHFNHLSTERQDNLTSLEFVQMFIRNIKGLPLEAISHDSGTNSNVTKPDWMHNPFVLKKLVSLEFKLYDTIKQWFLTNLHERRPLVLESYLSDVEYSISGAKRAVNASSSGNGSSEDIQLYMVSHSLLVYRMIRRFAEDLPPILAQLQNKSIMHNINFKNLSGEELEFPNSVDLQEALQSLSRMQIGNNLNSYDMAKGIFENHDTGIALNALHALEIGTYYLYESYYDYGIQWLHIALDMVVNSRIKSKHPEIVDFLEQMLNYAIQEHNEDHSRKNEDYWNPKVFTKPIVIPYQSALYQRRMDALYSLAAEQMSNSSWNWAIVANSQRLCGGESLQPKTEAAKLKCWYEHDLNHYWLINPLKLELLNRNPRVLQVYDFIGDTLIERMTTTASLQLHRSTVVNKENLVYGLHSKVRTSSQTWLSETQTDYLRSIPLTKRLELLTGLEIRKRWNSENYQVATYGPSHHYEVHLDAFDKDEVPVASINMGNRVTTVMGYLSNVKAGGRTVFPVLGIYVNPIKGSILMWNNLKRNGVNRDERTWHGGCPVILGIKWITNKWIYNKENLFKFKCTLDPNE